jgi:2-iminobutanoate/2-iminopropanoate deaminase
MRLDRVVTEASPRAIGPYSQGVVAGDWLYVSGQIGIDPASGELVAGSFAAEARRALENLGGVLRAGGSGFDRVVRVTVYLTDLGTFGELNTVYEEVLAGSRPARSTVGVASLPRGARVELDAVALRG